MFKLTALAIIFLAASISLAASQTSQPWQAPDLNPVTIHDAPNHEAITLVADHQPRATICVMQQVDPLALKELTDCLKLATGADVPVIHDKIQDPAIVIGDCPEAAAQQLASSRLPPEGL